MRVVFSLSVLALFFLTACPLSYADMYSYTDAQGTMHFVDDPSKIPAKERKKARAEQDPSGGEFSSIIIEFYSDDTCKPCRVAENFMKSRGFLYTKYNPNDNHRDYKRMEALGGDYGVPFFVINSQKVEGFDPDEIDKLMNYTARRK
jgi:glutaredoxin